MAPKGVTFAIASGGTLGGGHGYHWVKGYFREVAWALLAKVGAEKHWKNFPQGETNSV